MWCNLDTTYTNSFKRPKPPPNNTYMTKKIQTMYIYSILNVGLAQKQASLGDCFYLKVSDMLLNSLPNLLTLCIQSWTVSRPTQLKKVIYFRKGCAACQILLNKINFQVFFSFLAQTNINNAKDLHYLHCLGPLSCVGCGLSLIEGSLFNTYFSSPVV